MTTPQLWPVKALPFQSVMFGLQYKTTSGGLNLLGNEQIVSSSASRWKARLTLRVRRMEQVLTYRSLVAGSDGKLGLWLIPTCSGFQRLVTPPNDNGIFKAVGVPTVSYSPFGDLSPFDDTTLFASKNVMGKAATSESVGATSMSIKMDDTSIVPIAGHYFSINNRLYVVSSSVATATAGKYNIKFRPLLREAVIADVSILDFSRPVSTMRLASDDSGELNLDQLRFADVTLDFVEVV